MKLIALVALGVAAYAAAIISLGLAFHLGGHQQCFHSGADISCPVGQNAP